MANHEYILIKYSKLSTWNKKFLFTHLTISYFLVVKYMIIIFHFLKNYAFHFDFSDLKLFVQKLESTF